MPEAQYFNIPAAPKHKHTSDMVMTGPLGFVYGILPADLSNDSTPLAEAVEDQLLKVLANMEAILKTQALTRTDVLACTIHITQFQRFHTRVVDAYEDFFTAGRLPTCSIIGVEQLPRHAMVSADVIVYRQMSNSGNSQV